MISVPFAHNSSTVNRATSMFKSNWGGDYFTNAPLEKFDFATINGSDRLLGVTICAPGFSLETVSLTGSAYQTLSIHLPVLVLFLIDKTDYL